MSQPRQLDNPLYRLIHGENIAAFNAQKPKDGEVSFKMEFRAPVFIGFRQLDLERWPASRLYALEYANPDSVAKLKLPLTLTLTRADFMADDADAAASRSGSGRVTDENSASQGFADGCEGRDLLMVE